MPGPPTPILGLQVPTVGADAGVWGTLLNIDLALIDNLGALSSVNVSSNSNATPSAFPETLLRVTTGASTISVTLPVASTCTGKVFTIKKVDSGIGTVSVIGAIDGQASYSLTNQFDYVRVYSNGATFDVIGNN